MNEKWDMRFLKLANHISQWSKDPSTKVGSVITKGKIVVSVGFNGFAKGVSDDPKRYDDRNYKYKTIIHAEENAIISASQGLKNCSMYVTAPPCSSCASKIIQTKIKRVVTFYPTKDFLERWKEDLKITGDLFRSVGIHFVHYKEFPP